MTARRWALALLGLGLLIVGLLVDARFDAPVELLGEIIACAGGFCLALAVFPRPRI